MSGRRPPRILVVEDEPAMREVLRARLSRWGYEVIEAGDIAEAEAQVAAAEPDVVVTDLVLPDGGGLPLLGRLKADDPDRPVILITAHGAVDVAVDAMKAGANDFLTKPLDWEAVEAVLAVAVREVEAGRQARRLADAAGAAEGVLASIVGGSRRARDMRALVAEVAETDATVLVTGESGTGKELVARAIHEMSARRGGPFVAVNAAAIPSELVESEILGHEEGAFTGARAARAGCFEMADGGTLLLDEIAEMPIGLQPKILRVLEDGRVRRVGGSVETPFDVRVIASTNQDPWEAVREGRLREDLFYRLHVFAIELPPLRERSEDVPLLAQHLLGKLREKRGGTARGFRDEALEALLRYPWPGNVRELRNVVERAVVLAHGDWVELAHLPPYVRRPAVTRPGVMVPPGASLAEAERLLILATLESTGNNKAEAARRLGVDVKTIRNKLRTAGP